MLAINRKLLRELWGMRGQALAIVLVITGGVAVSVMSLSLMTSLKQTRDSFYQDYRFAQIFADLKRAPLHVAEQIAGIPGVSIVETRVVAGVNLEVENNPGPVTGQLLSIPDNRPPLLNRLYMRRGRLPADSREIAISEGFADANGLQVGDSLTAIINGKRQTLRITGIALSPEHIYQIAPGAMLPDFERYGVMWMARTPLAEAYDMDGAFNNVVLQLERGANTADVIERLDLILDRYGGQGAYDREDQLSNRFLRAEFEQLQTMAILFPAIFLSVAGFLLNVVISRLMNMQRELVATLKAFGYSNTEIVWHYVKLVLLIAGFGLIGGTALGVWLAMLMGELYMEFYSFPFLDYRLDPLQLLIITGVTLCVALAGTLRSVLKAANEPPARAMQPSPPENYRKSRVENLGLQRWLSQPSRMVLRHLQRRPLKALLATLGISLACAIMVVGNFQPDSIRHMVQVQFNQVQREDITVTFIEPTSQRALYSLQGLQGVEYAEGFRNVPVRLRYRHREYRTSLEGLPAAGSLRHLLNADLEIVRPPPEGILLSKHLGVILGAAPGDMLTVEVLEGARPRLRVPVVAMTEQYLGTGAYMQRDALNRLMGEGPAISGAYLTVDKIHANEIYRELQQMPRVAGVSVRQDTIDSFNETLANNLLTFTFINSLLGTIIAFGVVYNILRISLSERSRELASLRVLGYTRFEVAYILLGETVLIVLTGTPLGFGIGYLLSYGMVTALQSDLYRVPLIMQADTFGLAAMAIILSAAISSTIMWRKVKHLDLISVLKAKE